MTDAVLLSGGVDSIALTFWKRPAIAITIDYGQRAAETEIGAAAEVARTLGIQHEVLQIDCSPIGSGDMSEAPPEPLAPVSEWWPFRNQLLVTLAAARGVSLGVERLLVGAVSTDVSHADGTLAFFDAIDRLTRLQEGAIGVAAPAAHLTTVELVRQSGVPRDLLAWAHSCHTGTLACGRCRGCVKHYWTMQELYGVAY